MSQTWECAFKYILSTIVDVIFCQFLNIYQIFLSSQVQRSVIIINKLVIRVASRVAEIFGLELNFIEL